MFETLILIGKILGAFSAIIGFGYSFYKFIYKRLFKKKLIDPILDRFDKIDKISENLKPNGGSSICDKIDRIERSILFTDARSRSLVHSLNIGEFIADKNGRYVAVNSILCSRLRTGEEQFLGSNWINLIHPEDQERVYENWQQTIKEKKDFVISFKYLTYDNKIIPVNVVATYLENNHTIIGWIGIVHFH